MPKIEKDLLKVKGSDGQWHYVPAVGGEGGSTPAWGAVQNKPFESLGDGLEVDENGVLSVPDGSSPNAVQYVAQELTDAQKAQARENIEAPARALYASVESDKGKYFFNSTIKYNELREAYNEGAAVYLAVGIPWTYIVPLLSVSNNTMIFAYFDTVQFYATKYTVSSNSSISVTFDRVVSGDNVVLRKQGTENAGKILGIGEDGNVVPQDKPTYTLPQATADALGGIKADAATAEDTQPVRIGADGKMKTKPYALTDADKTAVAEEVVADGVAATLVDIPTGGGGKVWKKLAEITLEADAKSVIVSQTDDGGEFAVDELYVYTNATNIEANTAKGRLSIKANDNTIALLGTSSPAGIDFGAYGKTGRNWLYLKSVNPLILLHGRWIETNTMDLKEVYCWQPNIFAQDANLPALNEAIAKVELYCVTSTSTFTIGSKFIIWGR